MSIRLFEELAPSIINLVSLPKTPPAPARRLHSSRRLYRPWEPSPTPEHDRVLEDLSALHRACLNVQCTNASILLVERVEMECESIAPIYFDTIIFPFLDEVLESLQESDVQIAGTAYEKSIHGILSQYQAHVAGTQPSPPTDWSRAMPSGLCGCPTCKQLQEFIGHPEQQRTEISTVFKVRQHAEKVLGNDFETITHKNSTPHTLEIIKTGRHFVRSLREWQAKNRAVESNISSFRERHNLKSPQPQGTEVEAVGTNGKNGQSSSGSILQTRPNPTSSETQKSPVSGDKRPRQEENDENLRPAKRVDTIDP